MSPLVMTRTGKGTVLKMQMMRRRVDNMPRIWPKVEDYLAETTRKQFESHGGQLGTPWRPLTRKHLIWKLRNGYPRNILVMTGDLKNSFRMLRVTNNSMVFGSLDRKANWHQHGTKRKGRQVNPPRPMLVATPEVRREVTDIVRKWIVGKEGAL